MSYNYLRFAQAISISFCVVMLLSACGSGKNESKKQGDSEKTASLQIQVVDTQGKPLSMVSVSLNDKTSDKKTAGNGMLTLENVPSSSSVVLNLRKEGYARKVGVIASGAPGSLSTITLTMIQQQDHVKFTGAEKSKVVGSYGATVSLPEGAFQNRQGDVIAGEINLAISSVDVSTEAGMQAFPGSSAAIDEDGNEIPAIVTYGTSEFVFTTSSGEEAQLAAGKKAVVELPIFIGEHPDGTTVAEGDVIPMWYLDESTGIWKQEGSGVVVKSEASKTGFVLRGEVSHFTWWNIDVPVPTGSVALRVSFSDSTIDTTGLVATVYGRSSRSLTRGIPLAVGVRSAPERVVANTELCFYAQVPIGVGTSNPRLMSSNWLCTTVAPNSTQNVDLVLDLSVFSLSSSVVSSATAGADIGACGMRSSVTPQAHFPPVKYSIDSGALPEGLVLNSDTGAIYGSVNPAGPFNSGVDVVVKATDAIGRTALAPAFNIVVSPPLSATIANPLGMLNAKQLYPGIDLISAGGGLLPYKYYLNGNGKLPGGMALNTASGQVSGTPATLTINGVVQDHYDVTGKYRVMDQNCAEVLLEDQGSVLYAPVLGGNSPAELNIGQPINFTASNSGGPVKRWSLAGSVPSWLSIDTNTGALTGTPDSESQVGNVGVTIVAENNLGHPVDPVGRAEQSINFSVSQIPPALNVSANQSLSVGQVLQVVPVNSGGVATGWSVSAGLPSWMVFDSATGLLSGSPSAGDVGVTGGITISASNISGVVNYGPFSVTVTSIASLPVISGSPAPAQVDVPFSFTPLNSGGAPNSWALTGTLPSGISFNTSTGELYGTPAQAGLFNGIKIVATNAAGNSAPLTLSLNVNKGNQSIIFADRDQGTVQRTANGTFTNIASGGKGTGNITYSSTMPSVASVDAQSGVITFISDGSTVINASKAEDANYLAATSYFTLTLSSNGALIVDGPLSVSFDVIADHVLFEYAPLLVSGTGVEWTVDNLPVWAAFDATTGLLSGYVNEHDTGIYSNITITATKTGTSETAAISPITITLLPASKPDIPMQVVNNKLTVYTANNTHYVPYELAVANMGGFASEWNVGGSYPDQASGWVSWQLDRYSYDKSTLLLQLQPDISHLGISSMTVTASNPLGVSAVTFDLEIKYGLPGMRLRGRPGEISVSWDSPVNPPVAITYDLYVSISNEFDPATFSDANSDVYHDYVSGTAITSFNGQPIVAGDVYYLMAVAKYNANAESRSELMKLDVFAMSDTGIDFCNAGTTLNSACNVADYPGQDAESGLDTLRNIFSSEYEVPRFSYLNAAGMETANYAERVCVRDNIAGLLWEYQPTPDLVQNKIDALRDTINKAGKCGVSNWRLPSTNELLTQVNFGISSGVHKFYNAPLFLASAYWTGDLVDVAVSAEVFWTVDFLTGKTGTANMNLTTNNDVILVSASAAPMDFVDNADGSVTDTVSGLTWKKCVEGYIYDSSSKTCVLDIADSQTFNWSQALMRVANVNNGSTGENLGYTDWRVPNILDLNTLLDRSSGPGVMTNGVLFPAVEIFNFWTSSTTYFNPVSNSVHYVWALDFSSGQLATANRADALSTRLVRSVLPKATRRWYQDLDGDGYGNKNVFVEAVSQPLNYVEGWGDNWDCNDGNADANPGNYSEIIGDGIDNNCNGVVDEGTATGV